MVGSSGPLEQVDEDVSFNIQRITVHSVVPGMKHDQNNLLLLGQQVIGNLYPWCGECSDDGLLFTETGIVALFFHFGSPSAET